MAEQRDAVRARRLVNRREGGEHRLGGQFPPQHEDGRGVDAGAGFDRKSAMSWRPMCEAALRPVSKSPAPRSHEAVTSRRFPFHQVADGREVGCDLPTNSLTRSGANCGRPSGFCALSAAAAASAPPIRLRRVVMRPVEPTGGGRAMRRLLFLAYRGSLWMRAPSEHALAGRFTFAGAAAAYTRLRVCSDSGPSSWTIARANCAATARWSGCRPSRSRC